MVSSILDIPNLFHSGVNVMETDDVAPECFLFWGSQTVMFFIFGYRSALSHDP